MTRLQKFGTTALCLALVVAAVMPPLLRGAAPGTPTTPIPLKPARTPDAIMADLQAAQQDALKIMPSLMSLTDPDFRKGDGVKVIPILKKMAGLFRELENAVPDKDEKDDMRMNRYRFFAFTAALGDKETIDALTESAKGTDADALSAKLALALSGWVANSKDAGAQMKLVDDLAPLAKENAQNTEVAATFSAMTSLGAANNTVTKKVIETIRANMKGPEVTALLAQLDGEQAQLEMVGKPLAVSGRTSTGGTFSTADLKGKVVMFDFWATWCGPCIGELPNVKKAYADYHAKGFEIVGFSCDDTDKVLNDFTAKNEMPWIQLRETSQTAASNWHPIAKQFHVDGIPQMFLIDRKGVLRYVDAREDLSKKVAELIAESDAPAVPAPK